MRAVLLVAVVFACALMGWLVYTQPTLAGSDNNAPIVLSQPSQPNFGAFSAVAEEKREQASVSRCDEKAAAKQLGHDDKAEFIVQCLQAADSVPSGHQR